MKEENNEDEEEDKKETEEQKPATQKITASMRKRAKAVAKLLKRKAEAAEATEE